MTQFQEKITFIKCAFNKGITYFDFANNYSPTYFEKLFKTAFKKQ